MALSDYSPIRKHTADHDNNTQNENPFSKAGFLKPRYAKAPMSKLIVDACVLIDSFQKDSVHRMPSIAFIDHCVRNKQLITMPAHGWFEVWCNVNRLSTLDRNYLHPTFAGKMELPLELIHIDQHFIVKYGNVNLEFGVASLLLTFAEAQ